MSYQTIKQPNGKLAVFSTVVDDFVNCDCTVDEVVEFYGEADRRAAEMNLQYGWSKLSEERKKEEYDKFMRQATDGIREMVEAVLAGTPRDGDWTWEEAVAIVKRCHGRKVKV